MRATHEGVLHAHCVGLAEALHDVYFFAAGQFSAMRVFTASRMTGANFSRRSGVNYLSLTARKVVCSGASMPLGTAMWRVETTLE